MIVEDETRTMPKMTEIPLRPIPSWRRKIYHPTLKTNSKCRRHATSRILQYYGRPRWPSSARGQHRCVKWVGHPRRHKFERCELFPRRTTEKKYHCRWCFQQQGATSVILQDPYPHRKPGDVPRMSPDDHRPQTKTNPFSTTHTKPRQSIPILETSHFRPAHRKQVNIDPPHKDQVNFDPYAKIKSISIPYIKTKWISTSTLKSSQFRSPL